MKISINLIKSYSMYGGLILILSLSFGTLSCMDTERGSEAPKNLRCEYQSNPLGVDVLNPQLSWYVNDTRRSVLQSAYQIQVGSSRIALEDGECDVWDSGKIDSDQSVHVVYGGPALKSQTRYHWRVRMWDKEDRPSPFSDMAWWETGLLSPDDWKADWIGNQIIEETPEPTWPWGYWIWHPKENGIDKPVIFRKSFDLPSSKKVIRARVRVTADNYFTAFLNGNKIGKGSNWTKVYEFEVRQNIHEGKNIIAVKAANNLGEICGFIFSMKIEFTDGSDIVINSNATWKTLDRAAPGWEKADFNDQKWKKVHVIEKYGGGTWGKIDPSEVYNPPRSILVRNEFDVNKSITSARAYVSGLGSYIMYLNGHRVGNDIFTPGWTDYPTRIQYQVYDVTELLNNGKNAVGALLGNMWWSGGLGWKGSHSYSRGPLRFLLQLEINYDDGSSERNITDQNWKTHDSPVAENHIYHGETYDARMEMPGWSKAGFDTKGWQSITIQEKNTAKFVSQQAPTIQITQEIQPVEIFEPDPGIYIFDMGQNMVGWVKLKVKGSAGTNVILRFAEVLKEDGNIYTENLRAARATDKYILKGEGTEVWEPHFTYHGFRYVELSGYPGKPSKDSITGMVIHSAAPVTLNFSCSNKLINEIHKNITWGQRGNMHSVPTDCPQRDERLGWMGDAQIFAPTASYIMDMNRFFKKWMYDISDCQRDDGAVHDVNPAIVVSGPAKPGWGDAVNVIPWVVYQFYGDKRIIEENYDAMANWVGYMKSQSKDYLYERSGYGDWIAVVESPKEPIGAVYFYYSTKLLAKMAGIIGKKDDEMKYNNLAEKIANAFQKKFFNEESGQYKGATQTANLLPFAFGITPDEIGQRVVANIVNDVQTKGNHPSTGFLGTAYLLPVLSQYGKHELAYKVASQKTYPSWGYMVEKGATTIWELWNSDTQGPGMNSRNHFALGSVGEWFYAWLAGIRPDPEIPGFKRTIIAPKPVGDLTWVKSEFESVYGTIVSDWEVKKDELEMKVTIPSNTTALVHIPVLEAPWLTIEESGRVLIKNGEFVGSTADLRLVDINDQATIFETGSGDYKFVAK